MASISSDNLARLLGTLPQELYDEIYDLTFTAHDGPCTITAAWRPPHLLHVDRLSRKQYGTSYFSTTTFLLGQVSKAARPPNLEAQWLASLDKEHLGLLRRINYVAHIIPNLAQAVRWRIRLLLSLHFPREAGDAAYEKVAEIELISHKEAARLLGVRHKGRRTARVI